MSFSVLELCAGGGGQALGLEMAGFNHAAAIEYEPQFCDTLRTNRPRWKVIQQDVRALRPQDFSDIDLLAAGVPCPPFSVAGKQLGSDDERDMFPAALAMVEGTRPRGVLFENVPGFASEKFSDYRKGLIAKLAKLGYQVEWRVLQAAEFGVPQLRPRFVLVALREEDARFFRWPMGSEAPPSVGKTLLDLMGSNGWTGAHAWAEKARGIGPTVVGGSKKHGGPDLGPTRARAQWRKLAVEGIGIANEPPDSTFPEDGLPKLTVRMVARVQGFPDTWQFTGKKTIAYRQVGNAFPPPVACAVGRAIINAFSHRVAVPEEKDPLAFEVRLLEDPVVSKQFRRTRASYI